jgi:hypothetical protein
MVKILYRTGGLAAEERQILHGRSARGNMGAGIAANVRRRWPKAFERYRRQFEKDGLALGTIVRVDCGDRVILKAITQERYGRGPNTVHASYGAVRAVTRQLDVAAWRTSESEQAASILGDRSRIACPWWVRAWPGAGGRSSSRSSRRRYGTSSRSFTSSMPSSRRTDTGPHRGWPSGRR